MPLIDTLRSIVGASHCLTADADMAPYLTDWRGRYTGTARAVVLPADTSAGIFTSGLLGESYIGLQPGGDPDVLKSGDEIVFTQPAVDLIQLVGKYMFSGGGNTGAAAKETHGADAPATEPQP